MGACSFVTIGHGATVDEAFHVAKEQAAFEYGHGGYTGTIAEKDSYTIIAVPTEWDGSEREYVSYLLKADSRVQDKYGPAGAIQATETGWMFFGYASE